MREAMTLYPSSSSGKTEAAIHLGSLNDDLSNLLPRWLGDGKDGLIDLEVVHTRTQRTA